MEILSKIKKRPLILGILFTMLLIGIVYAATSYQVNSGAQVTIDEHTVCKKVTNNNALAIFVPTNTADEWTAFRTYASGVTYAECCQDADADGYGVAGSSGIANGCTYDVDDCCDSDNRAYPGEGTYYTTINNCSSWDYDCSGTTEKSNCTYDTVSRSGATCSCYWTSTCLAGTATGYQYCTETSNNLACGASGDHRSCAVGCRERCPTNSDWTCDSPPCPGGSCQYSTYYYNKFIGTRTCSCK